MNSTEWDKQILTSGKRQLWYQISTQQKISFCVLVCFKLYISAEKKPYESLFFSMLQHELLFNHQANQYYNLTKDD